MINFDLRRIKAWTNLRISMWKVTPSVTVIYSVPIYICIILYYAYSCKFRFKLKSRRHFQSNKLIVGLIIMGLHVRSITGFIDSTFGLIGVGTIHVCVNQAFSYECVTEKHVLISQPKHMLWVLRKTVSLRRFF